MIIPNNFKNIVILTGAGISAESGIKTFRDCNGLWENHDIMEVASIQGFRNNPKLVYDFYNARKAQLQSSEVSPNAAHHALAQLESKFKGNVTIITQNVDDLHERSGSHNIIHMHGELLKARCQKSQKVFTIKTNINESSICSCCREAGNLRPHIVWFGETPLMLDEIELELSKCDLFLSIGTSGEVYPAASFINYVKELGAMTIEQNLQPTKQARLFDIQITGEATKEVPRLVERLLS
ncbi:NAD-dependent deacetylase (Regulatory protein SIR2 homolog) [Halobacteriovorax marinus SJ]|uniref:NAD-dependent protein deacylase n=1 Tax=Halobacteriovorax marinus (strain ATCC BAA-682 / DSM 15412 / SJ) TaxID=862908 RepID=E1WZQ2_HALMS|nr:NAD-dependent deacylase [Halobacteriovorax marinus]CBW26238.1 NAD-dependent deacetylase (Regulatory protein SIR2 homolog) [Halobacteriovorax marinus SJ]